MQAQPLPLIVESSNQFKYSVPARAAFRWILSNQVNKFTAFNSKTGRGYCFKAEPKYNDKQEISCWFISVLMDQPIEVNTKAVSFETKWAFLGIVDSRRESFKPSKKSFLDLGNIAFKAIHAVLGIAKSQAFPEGFELRSRYCLTATELISAGMDLTEQEIIGVRTKEALAPAKDIRPARQSHIESELALMCRRPGRAF